MSRPWYSPAKRVSGDSNVHQLSILELPSCDRNNGPGQSESVGAESSSLVSSGALSGESSPPSLSAVAGDLSDASAADFARRTRVPAAVWGGRLDGSGSERPWADLHKDLALVEPGEGSALGENLSRLPIGSNALVAICGTDRTGMNAICDLAPSLGQLVVVVFAGFESSESHQQESGTGQQGDSADNIRLLERESIDRARVARAHPSAKRRTGLRCALVTSWPWPRCAFPAGTRSSSTCGDRWTCAGTG